MNEPHELNPTVDLPSKPADSLEAGLAAGFGRRIVAPRSSLGNSLRPMLLREAEGESAHVVRPRSDAMPSLEETGNRYQLSGEIARGGMGAVLRGRDVDLGRDLAVKVLLEKYSHRPEVARRFIEEAQIGGQLQHPGVVPVYDIGRFGDRPFFTMKLVKGQTLAAILGERTDSTADRPRLLSIAVQVAQTLAYAHAKGVIHRDLKPANIMVGAFGEVQVMDWGLAKVLAEGGIADEERASRAYEQPKDVTTIRTARSSGSTGSFGTDTEAGSLLGTPAYMPPEQANGDIVNLDRRADVFGLGAILCEILTGKPPYVGRSGEEVRRKAANGDLSDATVRLDACGADAELIALTKKCLSPEAIDRPKDAQEVTDGLSAYLNGVQERLQTAERERAVAVVREAEQRKKRKVQLALAAAVIALMLGGGAFAFWRAEQAQAGRERDARNAEAVAALLGQAEEALKAGDAAKAVIALEAAKKRSAEGGAEQDAERLKRLDADLALLRDLDAVDQFRWTLIDGIGFPERSATAARWRTAFAGFGIDVGSIPPGEAADRVRESLVRDRLVAALDLWLVSDPTVAVRDFLRAVDPDPYREPVRDAVFRKDGAKLVELAGRPEALAQPPGFAASLGQNIAVPTDRRREVLTVALRLRPGNLALLMSIGETFKKNINDEKYESAERQRWYQAAVAAHPWNVSALNNLGATLFDKGDFEGALASVRESIRIDPNYALAHLNVGNALGKMGDLDGAIAAIQKGISLDPTSFMGYHLLGGALYEKKELDGSVVAFQKSISINPTYAYAHNNLGKTYNAQKKLDAAIDEYRKAIEIDPNFAWPHSNLGTISLIRKDWKGAIDEYRKAIEIDPTHIQANNNLGFALAMSGRPAEGLRSVTAALERNPPAWADDPRNSLRFNAACLAMNCADGKGADAPPPAERPAYRKLALDHLKAALSSTRKLAATDRSFVSKRMHEWLADEELASIRDAAALAKLPVDEQKAFTQLWADMAALLKKAEEKAK